MSPETIRPGNEDTCLQIVVVVRLGNRGSECAHGPSGGLSENSGKALMDNNQVLY